MLWGEQGAGDEETWQSEEEEEERHGARKQVPGGSVEEVGLGGRGDQREVGIVVGCCDGKERRNGCRGE